MIVVSDNSPLQYLILIGCEPLLARLYGEVLTTPQVIAELSAAEAPEIVRAWAKSPPGWLRVEAPQSIDFLDRLDVGEASALSLAKEKGASLVLIDERAGNETARALGIHAIGTLGLLIEGGLEGMIDFEASIRRLTLDTSFYATPRLIQTAREIFRKRRRRNP